MICTIAVAFQRVGPSPGDPPKPAWSRRWRRRPARRSMCRHAKRRLALLRADPPFARLRGSLLPAHSRPAARDRTAPPAARPRAQKPGDRSAHSGHHQPFSTSMRYSPVSSESTPTSATCETIAAFPPGSMCGRVQEPRSSLTATSWGTPPVSRIVVGRRPSSAANRIVPSVPQLPPYGLGAAAEINRGAA